MKEVYIKRNYTYNYYNLYTKDDKGYFTLIFSSGNLERVGTITRDPLIVERYQTPEQLKF